jgi:hypothetical protein
VGAEKGIQSFERRFSDTLMASEHPFQTLFETLGRFPQVHAESINRNAYEALSGYLSLPVESTGRCILLRAPRAGHGKTHLLSRIQHHLSGSHEFIPLQAAYGCQIDAATVTDDTLRRLLRPLPASGGLCALDLVTRRLFAMALQPLVNSGEVPCQDREAALSALRLRPIETFDFHHPNAVTAHWARENFDVLGQRLSAELALRCGMPVREVAFWVGIFFQFAATAPDHPQRLRFLSDAVHAGNPPGSEVMERLEALLGMLTLSMRVVLVADELEGFSTDETAALRLAAFVGLLRQSVERLDVIISVNLDIWQSAFLPKLSGGLADRLSEVVVELAPLTDEEMVILLDAHAPGLGRRILSHIDEKESGRHARGLLRAAREAWLRAAAARAAAVRAAAAQAAAEPAPAVKPESEESFVRDDLPEQSAQVPEAPPSAPSTEPPPSPPGQEPPPPAPEDGRPGPDRVDELLRQFRERYSRSSS